MNKAEFFAAVPALKTETVVLPGGVEVKVRELTVRERVELEATLDGKSLAAVAPAIVLASAVDDDGNQLFGKDDYQAVDRLPSTVLLPIAEAAVRVNAMRDEDVEALGKD